MTSLSQACSTAALTVGRSGMSKTHTWILMDLCINKHGLSIGVAIIRKTCMQQQQILCVFPTAGNTTQKNFLLKAFHRTFRAEIVSE